MPIQNPFTLMLCGPSSSGLFKKKKCCLLLVYSYCDLFSGKTTFALQLLRSMQPIKNMIWLNGEKNALPKEINTLAENVEVSQEIPDSFESVSENSLIIIDDLMTAAYTKGICDLFTKGSHHKNISVILITQNVFHQGKYCRDISLNCKYLVLFKNPRDKSQIFPLARQIYPENPTALVKVYKEATSKPFGYLFLDLTQTANDIVRFQTDIFNENYITCFCPAQLLNDCQKNETLEGKQTYTTCLKKL